MRYLARMLSTKQPVLKRRQLPFVRYCLILFTFSLFCFSSISPADDNLSINIRLYGNPVPAELVEHSELMEQIRFEDESVSVLLYTGQLIDYPGSWVRLSYINEQWRGLVFVNGEMHRIDAHEGQVQSVSQGLFSYPLQAESDKPALCATESLKFANHVIEPEASNLAAESFFSSQVHFDAQINPLDGLDEISSMHVAPRSAPMLAGSISYEGYCSQGIDGLCVLPEIQFAYDIAFQEQFADPLAELIDHINIAEGFFQSDLGMRFSIVAIHALTPSEDATFDGHANLQELLGTVAARRLANNMPYAPNRAAFFHLVSGRDFTLTQNGSTLLGAGYIGTACSNSGLASAVSLSIDAVLLGRIIAHEIGHNLGAEHDEDTVCIPGRNLMSSVITLGLNGFSDCSRIDIATSLAARINNQCFDFPADISILPANSGSVVGVNMIDRSTAEVVVNEPDWQDGILYIDYQINSEPSYAPIRNFSLIGTVAGGEVLAVSLGQLPCDVINPARYECTGYGFPSSLLTATLETSIQKDMGATSISVENTLLSLSTDSVDINAVNDRIYIDILSGDYLGLSYSASELGVELNWFIHLADPNSLRALGVTAYRIEFRPSDSAISEFSFLERVSLSEHQFFHDIENIDASIEYRVVLESDNAEDLFSLPVVFELPDQAAANASVSSTPSIPSASPQGGNSGGGSADFWTTLILFLMLAVRHCRVNLSKHSLLAPSCRV